MSRKLVITDGTRERELQLVGRLVVGRDPTCDISDDHSLLSRRHAEFVTIGDAVTIRDLGSRNGVFVNGSRAAERTLDPGDVVQIGPLRARYVVDGAPLSITLDGDRTAMLRTPAAAAATSPVPPLPSTRSVLEDTAVPVGGVDEDVTRMVAAPSRPVLENAAPSPGYDEEVTRFTPGPLAPDLTAVIHAAPPLAPPVTAPSLPVSPAMVRSEAPPLAGTRADAGLGSFVAVHAMLLAAATVAGTLASEAIAPGLAGILLAFGVAGAAAFLVAQMINRRVSAALEGSGPDRS